jgi:hypothetical protein
MIRQHAVRRHHEQIYIIVPVVFGGRLAEPETRDGLCGRLVYNARFGKCG